MSGTALSIGQFAELSAAVLKALPRELDLNYALLWTRNGKKLADALRSALSASGYFEVFIECEVGGKANDELINEINASGRVVPPMSKYLMERPEWMPGPKERVKFGCAKIQDLWSVHEQRPTTTEVLARIVKLGHSPCEPGDAPAVRLVLTDEQLQHRIWVAMKPIPDTLGEPSIFGFNSDNKRLLASDTVGPATKWGWEAQVLFRLGK